MDPPSPISELDRRNVTLFCDLVSGYPNVLTRVNWYMDGNLLKELPDCPDNPSDFNNDLCDIDPSKLLLEHVSKLFHGNYSCEAANEAGWSEMSEPKQLEIYCKYQLIAYLYIIFVYLLCNKCYPIAFGSHLYLSCFFDNIFARGQKIQHHLTKWV